MKDIGTMANGTLLVATDTDMVTVILTLTRTPTSATYKKPVFLALSKSLLRSLTALWPNHSPV